jgi:hypothetical protein
MMCGGTRKGMINTPKIVNKKAEAISAHFVSIAMLAKYIGALLMNPYDRWESLYAESRDHETASTAEMLASTSSLGGFAVIDPFASWSSSFLPFFL